LATCLPAGRKSTFAAKFIRFIFTEYVLAYGLACFQAGRLQAERARFSAAGGESEAETRAQFATPGQTSVPAGNKTRQTRNVHINKKSRFPAGSFAKIIFI